MYKRQIVGHDIDQEYGAFRCETSIDGDTKFINNLLISENSTAPSFTLNGANKEAYSMGYNLYQRVNNFTMDVSDTAYPVSYTHLSCKAPIEYQGCEPI